MCECLGDLQPRMRLGCVAVALAITLSGGARALGSQDVAGKAAVEKPSQITAKDRLQDELERLSMPAEGVVGLAAVHLESGRSIAMNGSGPFPMASTYKVPIAVQLLTLVDREKLDLSATVEITAGDLHPGSGLIATQMNHPGAALSLRNLLELMLSISDNSASDLCLRAAGGADAVTARVRELGIEKLRVDRPTVRLIADYLGLDNLDAGPQFRLDAYRERVEALSEEQRRLARESFGKDPRDTSTPIAAARLLAKIWHGEALGNESTSLLKDIMRDCQTGEGRIKGMLPDDTEVAHKTGTIGGTTNDIGVVTLPDSAGHLVLVIFIKNSEAEIEARERVIAQIARTLYDYFLFTGAAGR